ncbi:MAG: DUF92 domain-containing protein [Thermomicrobiales bacterium]|nr:DUF92 domain-containing protein [Thermomicrobiales bacterium]
MSVQPISTWILAAICAALITGIAWRFRALAPSGVIAATMMGTVVVGAGGWWPGFILVAFFVSSSAISHIGSQSDHQARGAQRDWVQVLANGWPMLIGCLLFGFSENTNWLLFGIGGIAAATVDTWSSELGRRSHAPPRLITTGKVVQTGTSGAVSSMGLIASFGGASLIAILLGISSIGAIWPVVLAIVIAGFAGGLIDSLLGATVQERRYCDHCQRLTESNPHRCGTSTRIVGGIRGINNDGVNVACAFTGAIIGGISGILFL